MSIESDKPDSEKNICISSFFNSIPHCFISAKMQILLLEQIVQREYFKRI